MAQVVVAQGQLAQMVIHLTQALVVLVLHHL
jgi:hypothetical protein